MQDKILIKFYLTSVVTVNKNISTKKTLAQCIIDDMTEYS